MLDAPEQSTSPDSVVDVHLRDYVRLVLARWPIVLALWIVVVVAAAIYSYTRTPMYQAVSRILVESSEVNLTDIKDAFNPAVAASSQRDFMQTQVQLLKDKPVLEAAVVNGGLLDVPQFRDSPDPATLLAKIVTVTPVRSTHLIDISASYPDPRRSAMIVNSVVDTFLANTRARRLGLSAEGLTELQHKQEDLRTKLDAATTELQQFTVSNNVVSFERTQNVELETLLAVSQKLTSKEPERLSLQARVEASHEALARGEPVDSLPDVLASEVIRALRLDLIQLEKEYSQMLPRLGSNHPQIQALSSQMETVRTRIGVEAGSIMQSLETCYNQALKEEQLLRERVKQQEAAVFRFNGLSAQYNVLKQNKDSIESTYQTIVRRIQEIDSNRMGGQGESIFVTSRASPPVKPFWPNHAKHMAVALILGMVAGVGLCFFLDYMDVTIKGDADIKNLLHSRVLAGIPPATASDDNSPEAPDLLVSSAPHSHAAEAFRALRTALALTPDGHPLRSVVVSSTMRAEGKTFVSINMAIAQANVNRKTLLVDADLRRPRLHKVFPVPNQHGFADLLSREPGVTVDMTAHPTGITNLWMMPCGTLPPNPVELLDSPRLDALLQQMLEKFDLVIFDSPPGLSLVDANVISRHVDGLLLVVRSFSTEKAAVMHVADELRADNVRLLGVVLNNVDVPENRYGYYYSKYRYYYYTTDDGRGESAPWSWPAIVHALRHNLTPGRQGRTQAKAIRRRATRKATSED